MDKSGYLLIAEGLPVRSWMMARSDCRKLRKWVERTLLVDPSVKQTHCVAACRRRVGPCRGWDIILHPMLECNGWARSAEQRYVEGSLGTSNSLPTSFQE